SWHDFTPEAQLAAALGVRDLYFAARESGAQGDLVRAAAAVVPRQGMLEVAGLSLSFHPAGRHKALRFMEATALPSPWRPFFARPLPQLPHLVAVFADPAEYNFRTFENILPLDRLLHVGRDALTLTPIDAPRRGDPDLRTLRLSGDPNVLDMLRALDDHGLYVPPLNAGSRGGQRFIFHAAGLANALTQALRSCFKRARLLGGFSHINPVFRCNHFEPGDAPFSNHLDTPYCDPARGHMSRYTLLIYLTGGEGAPALRVHETELRQIAPMTVAMFHQRHEHEGHPYLEGAKVFLRTELVFKAKPNELIEAPGAAALFAKACYLTGECVFAPELSRYAHEAYDRSAKARWNGTAKLQPRVVPFLSKTFRGTRFITNGYDYWFNGHDLTLPECAALALLDLFNCKLGGQPFRAQCETTTLERSDDGAWVPDTVMAVHRDPNAEPLTSPLDKEMLFPEPETADPEETYPEEIVLEFGSLLDKVEPTRCQEVIDLFVADQAKAKADLLPAAIVVMGQEVFLEPERFLIDAGTIQILSTEPIKPLNFAAFTTLHVSPSDSLKYERATLPGRLLPPLLYRRTPEGCVHLTLDFFRNAWVARPKPVAVRIPSIDRSDY
ncbi:MAG: hypothetical protein AAFX99_29580, partial [Myxococcota bacterium]